jgi:SAM-dependent MidA family methyltransferase
MTLLATPISPLQKERAKEFKPPEHIHPAMEISADVEPKNDSLAARLRARIEREGPISFREWMQAALYDDRNGYYSGASQLRQGRNGDYRTAPETSPLFAATFARYFSKLFSELGSPSSWTIFEAGAGSGEFAYGVLTALQAHQPRVFAATNYSIDEVGADARLRAKDRLTEFTACVRFERFYEVAQPAGAGIVFSNELIDALPVHRVTMRAGKLRELCVGVNQDSFEWVESDPHTSVEDYCLRAGLHLAEGQIAEVNLNVENFLFGAALLLKRGFVITVDYGAERDELVNAPHRHEGTLRAFHRHRLISDALASPGEQDLTTTIDWTQLREAGARVGLETLRHERLDQFLLHEGLLDELEMLASKASDVDALRLRTSARELIMPHGLAASFQVLVQQKHPGP